jgi:DNA recombination-dependent growth factor C
MNNIKATAALLKNATLGKVSGDDLLETLFGNEDNLEGLRFVVAPHHKQSIGLAPPSPYDERLHYDSPNSPHILWFKLMIQKRSVSKDKLNDAVQQRLLALGMTEEGYEEEDFKSFIDSVESSLLPDANYTNKQVLFSLNVNDGTLLIYSASAVEVDLCVQLLETILGEVDGLEIDIVGNSGLSDTLTAMLIDDSLCEPLEWGSKLLLVDPDTKAKGSLDNQSVASVEAHTMIEAGKQYKTGKFLYDGYIKFELNDEYRLKGLAFDGTVEAGTEEESFEMTLAYVNLEVSNLYGFLSGNLK